MTASRSSPRVSPRAAARDLKLSRVAQDATPESVRDLIGGVNASLQNNAGKSVEKVGEGMPARWKLIG